MNIEAIIRAESALAPLGWTLNRKTLTAGFRIDGIGSIHIGCKPQHDLSRNMLSIQGERRIHLADLSAAGASLAKAGATAMQVRAVMDALWNETSATAQV
jgi:ketopantoate hydroxymethyltransferase